jgi:hypothetical protein
MTLSNLLGSTGRTLAFTGAIVGVIGLTVAPRPAHAFLPLVAAAIGISAATTTGTVVGAAVAPPPVYVPPAPAYSYGPAPAPTYSDGATPAPIYYSDGPRSCWSPYYGRYYAC